VHSQIADAGIDDADHPPAQVTRDLERAQNFAQAL
jgi:hypothetical protein